MKRWVDDGLFEIMTVPFNIMSIGRLEAIEYALSKGVKVIAMNPLSGGMFGGNVNLSIPGLEDVAFENATEMALKYVEAMGVSALCGISNLEHAQVDIKALSKPRWSKDTAVRVQQAFDGVFGSYEHTCTGCGYCKPCPANLEFPQMFKMLNYYQILNFENAKGQLKNMDKWFGDNFKLDRCLKCGDCESRCPNSLPIMQMIDDTLKLIREEA